MKKALVLLSILFFIGAFSVQADDPSATLGWTPPTHKALGTDCDQNGDPLLAADIARLEYTLSYRVKGETEWINEETNTNQITLEDLAYATTYEASVGAHWPGQPVLCATDLMEFTTDDEPAPGKCSDFHKLP